MISAWTANIDALTKLVDDIFNIKDITTGGKQQGYVARYRGMLKGHDSEKAYNWLSEKLQSHSLIPLFRWEGEKQVILLVPALPKAKADKSWVNILLFALTFLSVLFAGALYTAEIDPFSSGITFVAFMNFLWQGWPFAVSFLPILAAHEFGHYIAGRLHKVNVSLPYFIPFPFSMIGTMGAFINMKEPPKNRKHLLDIGVAGPLAGLCVAVPVLFIGLSLSKLDVIPTLIPQDMAFQIEGNSIFYLFAKYAVFGKLLPQPASYGTLSPLLYWLRYFFTGLPLPLGGLDVMIHPVAWAGWAGLLVTSLNLIPAGQLDGGHVLYVLFGRKNAQRILPFVLIPLIALGFVWYGWWLWAGLIFLLGRRYAEPLDQITVLDKRRKVLAVFVLIIFILIFMPVPLIMMAG